MVIFMRLWTLCSTATLLFKDDFEILFKSWVFFARVNFSLKLDLARIDIAILGFNALFYLHRDTLSMIHIISEMKNFLM